MCEGYTLRTHDAQNMAIKLLPEARWTVNDVLLRAIFLKPVFYAYEICGSTDRFESDGWNGRRWWDRQLEKENQRLRIYTGGSGGLHSDRGAGIWRNHLRLHSGRVSS